MSAQFFAKAIGIGVTVALAFWHSILGWAKASFFPWVEKHLPTMLDTAKKAFEVIDEYVAVPIRRAAKAAWRLIRQQLLKVTMSFEQRTNSAWGKKMTIWAIENLEERTVKKTVTEESIAWDDLPVEIREQVIRTGESKEVDVTDLRDQELVNIA